MVIAIDGPAGSGKTTIARNLADRLKISYLDTGATYRVLTLKAIELKLNLSDKAALKKLAQEIKLKLDKGRVYLDGIDVTIPIRTPLVDKNISLIVSYPEVREVMAKFQRDFAAKKDCVVEGRDITTVVLPHAEFKFYLDADPKIRTKRRFNELKEKGIAVDFEEVDKSLVERDNADKNRRNSPLKISLDAIYIDTSSLSIEEVIETILGYINKNSF